MWVYVFIWALTAFTIYIGMFWLILAVKNRKKFDEEKNAVEFPSISIIVPAFNEEKNIRKCIDSLLQLKYPSKPEIIVVNDGSKDSTSAIAEKYRKNGDIKLINQKNKGKGAAINRGVKSSVGELIVIMDADSSIEKDALLKMVGYFDNPKVGAVISSIKATSTRTFIQKLQNAEYVI